MYQNQFSFSASYRHFAMWTGVNDLLYVLSHNNLSVFLDFSKNPLLDLFKKLKLLLHLELLASYQRKWFCAALWGWHGPAWQPAASVGPPVGATFPPPPFHPRISAHHRIAGVHLHLQPRTWLCGQCRSETQQTNEVAVHSKARVDKDCAAIRYAAPLRNKCMESDQAVF